MIYCIKQHYFPLGVPEDWLYVFLLFKYNLNTHIEVSC